MSGTSVAMVFAIQSVRFWTRHTQNARRKRRGTSSPKTAERLESRCPLAADSGVAASTALEPSAAVYVASSLISGPSPIVFSESQIIGHEIPSFVISSIANGVVEKFEPVSGGWVPVSLTPNTSNPAVLLQMLDTCWIQPGDRIRWIPESVGGGLSERAFEVLGWDQTSEPTPDIPTTVPTAVEDLLLATTDGNVLTLSWNAPTSGDATTYTVTNPEVGASIITITDATLWSFPGLDLTAEHVFTVAASNDFGAGPATTVTYTPPTDQTVTFSPVTPWDGAYTLSLAEYDMGVAEVPTLQSFARGVLDDQWVLLAGRTNGLHGFGPSGTVNFPPKYQNTDVWVIDPITKETWSRSLADTSSGLSQDVIDSLSATNTQVFQEGETLFVVGGYVYTNGEFTTYNALSAIHMPSLVAWVKGVDATLDTKAIVQVAGDEATDGSYEGGYFQVTGGSLNRLGDHYLLVFGQNFEGPYTPGRNGVYTSQVRSFEIVYDYDAGTLSYTNLGVSPSGGDPSLYRRRDLNVFPSLAPGVAGPEEGVTVLAGVFYNGTSVWTVPVEIGADGVPTTVDPATDPSVFKQAMNHYESAKIGLYSHSTGEMTEVLLGGISANVYDAKTGGLVYDKNYGFTNQISAVIRAADGSYSQEYLDDFPAVYDASDKLLHLGAEAIFFAAPGVNQLAGGILDLDTLTTETVIGYVFGGIAADKPNFGQTVASPLIFEVTFSPLAT
jgi:hypothetical protein